LPKAITLALPA